MAQYYLVATNWLHAHVASLGGWENTEIINKCHGGNPEYIKAQIAGSMHVKFDTLDLNRTVATAYASFISPTR
jgi:hypothetical protein